MTRAVIFITNCHSSTTELRLAGNVVFPPSKPLDVQENACRTYCDRVGYSVIAVEKSDKPIPEVKPRWGLRISSSLSSFKLVHEYDDSKHPYYRARNKVECGDADVLIEFCQIGPSHKLFPEELASTLLRIEYASLWEIEPPTEIEREMYAVVKSIENATSNEDGEMLVARLEILATLSREEKAALEKMSAQSTPIKPLKDAIWEYLTLVIDPHTNLVVSQIGAIELELQLQEPVQLALEKLGKTYWELVGVYQTGSFTHFMLKRPIDSKKGS